VRKLIILGSVAALLVSSLAAAMPPTGVSTALPADPITFDIDPTHSSVSFRVRHLGLSRVIGTFGSFHGSFTYDPDDPSNSSVSVTVDLASIDTGVERRDNHLRSADFFDVETYPTMTFASTEVRAVDAEHLEIVGDLTIHGITKSVVFEAEFLGMAPRRGGQTSAFEATARVNRHDFDLTWNMLQEGLQIVGDDIDITIQIEAHTPRQR